MRATHTRAGGPRAVGAVLFLCLFAAQSGAVALSPILARVARDLGVSTAAAGQLRTIAGLAAATSALTLGHLARRIGLGRQLLAGALLLALGSLGSAAAPGIVVLACAQVPVGAAIGILTAGATLGAAEWVAAEHRAKTLSWTLIGQPAAWIVGMPLLGVAGERSWRLAWLVFPLAAALLAAVAVGARSSAPPPRAAPANLRATLAAPGLGRWLAAELLTSTAWAGTLVYAGALFAESYGSSGALTGAVLAVGAAAYVCGNLAFRRLAGREPRGLRAWLTAMLAVDTVAFGVLRPSVAASAMLFAAAAFTAGGRTFLSSAFGLAAPAQLRPGAMALRAASMQLGYCTGSFAGGAALALGGYGALGVTLGAVFLAAALTGSRRASRPAHPARYVPA